MVPQKSSPHTVNAELFDPEALLERWAACELTAPVGNDLQTAVKKCFGLKENDSYTYHAVMSVSLAQVQQAVNHGGKGGLHIWYLDQDGKPVS